MDAGGIGHVGVAAASAAERWTSVRLPLLMPHTAHGCCTIEAGLESYTPPYFQAKDSVHVVVRFHSNTHTRKTAPPDYFSRGQQRRLLLLVLGCGLALVLVREATRPRNWAWLAGRSSADGPDQAEQGDRPPRHYNTRVRVRDSDPLPLGTYLIEPPAPAGEENGGKFFPGVRAEQFGAIRDHTHVRGAESNAWFNLFEVLDKADSAALAKQSLGRVGFVQLFEQPAHYRGKLVTVRGVAKRAFNMKAPKNDVGIDGYHQIWLFPQGGPMSPIVVCALEVPDGFPNSRLPEGKFKNISAEIEATGFFFKNWAYSTGNEILSAPMLMAKTIEWKKPSAANQANTRPRVSVGVMVAAVVGVAILAVIFAYLSGRPKRLAHEADTPAALEPAALRSLEALDSGGDIGAVLRSLAERDTHEEQSAAQRPKAAPPPTTVTLTGQDP